MAIAQVSNPTSRGTRWPTRSPGRVRTFTHKSRAAELIPLHHLQAAKLMEHKHFRQDSARTSHSLNRKKVKTIWFLNENPSHPPVVKNNNL